MIEAMRTILQRAVEQLSHQLITYLPSLVAALVVLGCAFLIAFFARWVLTRIFKGRAFDRFLSESGVGNLIDRSGRLRATRLVAGTAYWVILLVGSLTAISAFDTVLSARIIEGAISLAPKLVVAGLILLGGAWLAQFLGRSTLVWAVNDGIPSPRRICAAVRLVVMFVAVVVAADQLDFAENVFLAAFVILVGGAVLAASLAVGLGGRDAMSRFFLQRWGEPEQSTLEKTERSLWNHL